MLDFILAEVDENGVFPTFQEIADEFGTHRSTAHEHVYGLCGKGYVKALGPARTPRRWVVAEGVE